MGKVVKFKPKQAISPDDPLRVEVHICGLCGGEHFWLYAKAVSEDVSIHGIACSRCGNEVQGTWQPKP